MTFSTRLFLYIVGASFIVLMGHAWWQTSLLSLVPWPLLISLVIVYTLPTSWRWLLAASFIAELFSTLPAGALTLVMFLPWVAMLLPYQVQPGFSLRFLVWVMGVAVAQHGLLFVAFRWPYWSPSLLWASMITALVAFLLVTVWYEAVEPYKRQRTKPRFKHR